LAEDVGITLPDYLSQVLPEVHYHISAACNEIIDLEKPEEFSAFLALLQHHGFPTPLLDWTLSPYIASYFAFKDVNDRSPESDYVKIFVFDYNLWRTTFQQPLDLREHTVKYVSVLRPYSKYNPRLIPQRAVYTVTNVDDMETYILDRSSELNKKFLYTATLSVKERPKVLRELDLMSINQMVLFPGIDGICEAFKEKFFSKDVVGPTPSEIMKFWQLSNQDQLPLLQAPDPEPASPTSS
jgi:hypothetical protein